MAETEAKWRVPTCQKGQLLLSQADCSHVGMHVHCCHISHLSKVWISPKTPQFFICIKRKCCVTQTKHFCMRLPFITPDSKASLQAVKPWKMSVPVTLSNEHRNAMNRKATFHNLEDFPTWLDVLHLPLQIHLGWKDVISWILYELQFLNHHCDLLKSLD